MVFLCDIALLIDVAILDQIKLDVRGLVVRDRNRAFLRVQHLAREVGLVRHTRASRQGVANVLLQGGHEVLVTFAGHNCQYVNVMNNGWVIHAFTILIDGQTQAAPDLLAA